MGLGLSLACSTALAASKAHEHGTVRLDVALDGAQLVIALDAPLDNLLGFERAPRTDAERKAAASLLNRLRQPGLSQALWGLSPAAQCSLRQSQVLAPMLATVAVAPLAPNRAKPTAPADDHADLEAHFEYTCANPAALRQLDLGLFDTYPRIQRINVQVAGPQGQRKLTLKRPQRQVPLTP